MNAIEANKLTLRRGSLSFILEVIEIMASAGKFSCTIDTSSQIVREEVEIKELKRLGYTVCSLSHPYIKISWKCV